jgi:response regulator of citrate/malate metabolism
MIYVVSSSNNPDDFIQAKSIQVADYIVKPINAEKIHKHPFVNKKLIIILSDSVNNRY